MKTSLLLIAITVGISGCTLFDRQEKRINYTENLTSPWGAPTIITDAKQRAIVNVPANVGVGDAQIGPNGKVASQFATSTSGDDVVKNHPTRIICAEPSPDVAQAISAAFTAAAQVDAKLAAAPAAGAAAGANQQIAGSGSVGSAYASSIAQLGERLSTVALLRDKMYRACEAYQNGAISDTSYTLMLSRFDKTMTSLLSSELAAGAFGRNLAALGGSASTSGVDPKQLADAKEAAKAAAKDLATAATLPETPDTEKAKKTEAVKQAATKLDDAVAKLADLELQAAATAAQSGPGATGVIGQIVGRSGTDADAVARINANFLDDDSSGSLIDTCLVALDRNRKSSGVAASTEAAESIKTQLTESKAREEELRGQLRDKGSVLMQKESALDFIMKNPANKGTSKASEAEKDKALSQGEVDAIKEELAELRRKQDKLQLLLNPGLSSTCTVLMLEGPDGLIDNLQEKKKALREIEAGITTKQYEATIAVASADKAKAEAAKAASEVVAAKTDKEKSILTLCNERVNKLPTPPTDLAPFNKCVADLNKALP